MTPRQLAAEVTGLPLEELAALVSSLPRVAFLSLHVLVEDRIWSDRAAALAPPAPVVVTAAAPDAEEILTADEAAAVLRLSLDSLYARVHRGELVPLPRCPKGRLKFRRGDLRPVANEVDRRYTPPHDRNGRANPPPPARLDATPARGGPQRDGDHRRPLGTRGAGRNTARRNEPWAPGQGAWADPQGDPRPKGRGV